MDIKKLLTGTIVGGVLFFLLGWLIYGIMLREYMHTYCGAAGHRAERVTPVMLYLVIGNFSYGAFLAFVFIKANVKTLMDGFVTGAVIGLLVAVAIDCMTYATTLTISKHGMLADVIASTLMVGVVGAVVALVTGGKKE